jgi:hypothetical protein
MAGEKKNLTHDEIHALRGKYKLVPNDKPFAEWMADLKREEKELEEAKFARMRLTGKSTRPNSQLG